MPQLSPCSLPIPKQITCWLPANCFPSHSTHTLHSRHAGTAHHEVKGSIGFTSTSSERLHTAMEPCLTTHTPPITTPTTSRHWRILRTSIISLIVFTTSMVFSPCGCCYTPHSTSRLLRNRMLSNTNSRRRIKQQVWRRGTQHAIRHVGEQHWDRNHKQER